MRLIPPWLRTVSPAELAERLRVERRGLPFVVYLDGAGGQRIVELADRPGPVCIGREPSADITLAWDAEVSRVHALLECVCGTWTIVDDGLSRNGSFVDGDRVRGRRRLEDGDSIVVGRTLLLFRRPAQLPSRRTVRAQVAAPPSLTAAQRRVLEALCRPLRDAPFGVPPSNREIADDLFLSVETVKSHMRTLFELFGIGDMPQNRKRAELVQRAFQRGVVSGLRRLAHPLSPD